MKVALPARILVASIVSLAVMAGCGRTDLIGDPWDGDGASDGPFVDTGADVPMDTLPDVPPDTWTDVPPDTWTDMPPDVPMDTWMDVPMDTRPDMPMDTWMDVPMDTMVDGPTDTRPDWPFDTGSDIPPDATGGIVGDPCASSASCTGVPGSGRMCLTNVFGYLEFPGGYCSATCTSAADCGPGGACVSVLFGRYCLEACSSWFECRMSEGYSCRSLFGSGSTYCLPPFPGGPDGGPVD